MMIAVSTQVKSAHEMGATYASIAQIIRNRDRVIVTDESGKGESVIMNIAEYDAMKESAWQSYVAKALGEVEAVKDDPSTWLSLDEFWQD
jgi:hypothetical protein